MGDVELAKLYEEGKTLGELSKQYSIPVPKLRKLIVGQGVLIRPRGRKKNGQGD